MPHNPHKHLAVLHLIDVIPGKIYLAHDSSVNAPRPCRVKCTEEPGHLRGHVYLDDYCTRGAGHHYAATGYITFIETNRVMSFDVKRNRPEDMWTFGKDYSTRKLTPLTKDWLMLKKMDVQMELDRLNDYLKFLDGIKEPNA